MRLSFLSRSLPTTWSGWPAAVGLVWLAAGLTSCQTGSGLFPAASTQAVQGGYGAVAGSYPPGVLAVVRRSADASLVQLADGSQWKVQPAGQASTLTWQPNDPIEIIHQAHPSYPAVLSNLRTGQGSRARRF